MHAADRQLRCRTRGRDDGRLHAAPMASPRLLLLVALALLRGAHGRSYTDDEPTSATFARARPLQEHSDHRGLSQTMPGGIRTGARPQEEHSGHRRG